MIELSPILNHIIAHNHLHARWLNTLSLMENEGAKKIMRSEHRVQVSETVLKHAAEEARHAWLLKRQIRKTGESLTDYAPASLIAARSSSTYLNKLDVSICRYLKDKFGYRGAELKYAAYLLVTYAIEIRADDLYPRYQHALDEAGSSVHVRGIIAEETHHLAEMREMISAAFEQVEVVCRKAEELEAALFQGWISEVSEVLFSAEPING